MKHLFRYRVVAVAAALVAIPFATCRAQPVTVTASHLDLDSLGPSTVACTFIITLSDTVGVDKVEVALGAAPGDTTLAFHVFDFDVSTGLPAGVSWQRDGSRVELAAGTADRQPTWFGRVRVKDDQGSWSLPVWFVRN